MSYNILQMDLMTWESAHQPLIFYHLSRDGLQGSGLSSEAQRSLSPTISYSSHPQEPKECSQASQET